MNSLFIINGSNKNGPTSYSKKGLEISQQLLKKNRQIIKLQCHCINCYDTVGQSNKKVKGYCAIVLEQSQKVLMVFNFLKTCKIDTEF